MKSKNKVPVTALFGLIFIISMFVFASTQLYAQDSQIQNNKASIEILPYYENWNIKNGSSFSELTNEISINYFPVKNTRLGFATRYASVIGDIKNLTGFSDSQLSIGQEIPDYNVILNAGVNIPSGKTKLTQDEFNSTTVISQNLFMLKTPSLGQGLNFFLGGTWAHPINENLVLGIGASYQIKSEYQPLKDLALKYKPSNEVCATGGFDFRINKTATITGDVTGIFYWSDKFGGQYIFKSGNRIISDLTYKQYFGYDMLSASVIYRNIAIDQLKGSAAYVENEKLNPNQFYISANYLQRFSQIVSIGYGIYSSIYEKTASFYSGYTVIGVSVSPQFIISNNVTIPLIIQFGIGRASNKPDLQNLEVGSGIKIGL